MLPRQKEEVKSQFYKGTLKRNKLGSEYMELNDLIIAKRCSLCNQMKDVSLFYKESTGLAGRYSRCKDCTEKLDLERKRKKREKRIDEQLNKELPMVKKTTEVANMILAGVPVHKNRSGVIFVGYASEVKAKQCGGCQVLKAVEYFNKSPMHFGGVESHCKECRNNYYEKNKDDFNERKRVYYDNNKELFREGSQRFRKNNPESVMLSRHNRRAKKLMLVNDLTIRQQEEILSAFNNACALSGKTNDLQLDHVIPLSVGHGGTTFNNMIPLNKTLNASKHSANVFEWFERNKDRFNLQQDNFTRLIEYLATVNKMTVDEYRNYVYWCHENPQKFKEKG